MLVIGYGNSLRGDDGIGRVVAEQVADWNLPHVRSLSLHQLTPELAEELSRVDRAVFIDACIDSHSIRIEPVEADAETQVLGHSLTPRSLLGMAQWLYDRTPEAWLISVPGETFEFSDRLSPTAEGYVTEILALVRDLLTQNPDSSKKPGSDTSKPSSRTD
ncbi:hydrogenase maturation protease [Baaleninema sp.]|uniref:hydrogenase maturation protease n=1 Tax=Baaleninema sp. TaxID=3101197 RepID=UPI003D0430CD